jgi:hypothetical protein
MRRLFGVQALGLLGILLGGCSSEVLFQSSFSSDPTGSPPSPTQAVGTASVAGDSGSVVVAPSPVGADKVVQISRAAGSQQINVLQGTLVQSKGSGTYSLLAVLYVPKPQQRQAVTVELDSRTLGLAGPILHLDFPNDCNDTGKPGQNTVRVNDRPGNCFGTFPNDQLFPIQITLNVGSASASASVELLGGASGSASNIPIAFPNLAQQFGAVTFWMGYPWSGSFDVTDIIVTYKKPPAVTI